tara:strand:+ start:310 stop:2019 length:1710 start_codon:yes stop_codon:yes gene_type:complete
MKFFIKNINLITLCLCLNSFYSFSLQQDIKSLNDSIRKYKAGDYQKALEFGFAALDLIRDREIISLDFVNTNYYIGETFYYIGDYKTSFEYLSKSLELYDLLNPRQRRNKLVTKPPWVLVIMGNVYLSNDDFSNAEKFYNEALENFKLFDSEYEEEIYYGTNTVLQNLSLIKRNQGEIELSRNLLDKVLESRIKRGIPVDIIQTYLNYMGLFQISGDDELLIKNYENIKNVYDQYSSKSSTKEYETLFYNANLAYSEFFISKGELSQSLKYLFIAKDLSKQLPSLISDVNFRISNVYFSIGMIEGSEDLIIENLNNLKTSNSQKIDNFKLLEKIYRIKGSTEQLLAVKDSIIFYNENQSSSLINEQFNTLENFILISDKQNDIKIYQARNTRLILISIFSLIILSLVTVSYRFSYALQKEKNKRLALEKEKIQNKLKLKQRELFSKVNFITQRNEYLNRIKSKLESKESNSEDLKNEISNIANSEKVYSDFDKMFSQVYPDFYKNLNIHGKLSQTDIRLASYIKMNHSNNEIARISGISIRTVESQRYRLSKKLNISADEDLNSFISKI